MRPVIIFVLFVQFLGNLHSQPQFRPYLGADPLHTYGNVSIFPTLNNQNPNQVFGIAEDFGPRQLGADLYQWHGGIDYNSDYLDADYGDLILALEGGTISEHSQMVSGTKSLIIEGNGPNGHNLRYVHVFTGGALVGPNKVNEIETTGCILKLMDGPENENTWAIIIRDNGNYIAYGPEPPMPPGQVTFTDENGVEHTLTVNTQVAAGAPVVPLGDSNNFPAHLHLEILTQVTDDNGNNIPAGDDRWAKDPLQLYDHDAPNYNIGFYYEDDETSGIDIIYPGTNEGTVQVHVEMSGQENNNPANRYDVVMNVDEVAIYIKPVASQNFNLIQGPNFRSEFSHGARIGTERINMDLNVASSNVGDWNRTHMQPFAYATNNSHPRDDYYFADFLTRIHKDDPMDGSNSPTMIAYCPDEARYNDGVYLLKARVTDVRDSVFESGVEVFTLDNFKPYVKEVEVKLGTTVIYTGIWECCSPPLVGQGMVFTSAAEEPTPGDLITGNLVVTVMTSEPLDWLQLSIPELASTPNGSMYQNMAMVPTNSSFQEWELVFSGSPLTTGGIDYHFVFEGRDFPIEPDVESNELLNLESYLDLNCIRVPTRIGFGVDDWENLDNIPYGADYSHVVTIPCVGDEFTPTEPYKDFKVNAPCLFPDFEVVFDIDACQHIFTNLSQGDIASLSWDFGDGSGSSDENPVHVYAQPGCYDVTLTIVNSDGLSSFITKEVCLNEIMYAVHVSCICSPNGFGAIELSLCGGEPPFSFSWIGPDGYYSTAQSPTDLMAEGTYQGFITDGTGATITTEEFLISFCSDMFFEEEVIQSCDGNGSGKISIHISEATLAPYAFIWTYNGVPYEGFVSSDPNTGYSSISDLSEGEYCVVVFTSNGCSVSQCWQIQAADSPEYSYVITPEVFGNDGAIDLTMFGTGPFIFDWSNGQNTEDVSGLSSGSYHVAIFYDSDTICYLVEPFIVFDCADLFDTISLEAVVKTSKVSGFDIDLSVVNGFGYDFDFQWSNGAQEEDLIGVVPGTYCVNVTHPMCLSLNTSLCVEVCDFGVYIDDSFSEDCEGQWVQAIASGGQNFTYLWNTGDTTSALFLSYNQEYCVTVTSSQGCSLTACHTAVMGQLEHTAVVTNASFGIANGAIDLNVSGGLPPYSYEWNTGEVTQDLTNIYPGIYCVTVSDQCAGFETCFNVGCEIAQGDVLANITPVGCSDLQLGAIELDLSNITILNPNFQILWSNGETTQNIYNLPAGQYCVSIWEMNTQCLFTECYNVSQIEEEPYQLTFTVDPGCLGGNNGEITVYPQGGVAPYSYYWNTGETNQTITNVGTGWSAVTVTDALGCEAEDFVFSWEMPVMEVVGQISGNPVCPGGDGATIDILNVSGGTPPYSYEWQSCFPCVPISGESGSIINDLQSPGYYVVTVTDSKGCVEEAYFEVEEATISYSANISSSTCQNIAQGSIELITSGNYPPFTFLWSDGSVESSRSDLIAGTYCVTIFDASGCSVNDCFIVPFDAYEDFDVYATEIVNPHLPSSSDGAITVATNGVGNFSYLWSTGDNGATISNLSPGNYTVTVLADWDTAALCQKSRTFTLNSCYELEFAGIDPVSGEEFWIEVPNDEISGFSIKVVNLPASSGGITEYKVLLKEDGWGNYSEYIPSNYSISWRTSIYSSSPLLGTGASLLLDIENYPYNYLAVTVSNGCEEKQKTIPVIGCEGEAENAVLVDFFLDEASFTLPCENGNDGVIVLDFFVPDSISFVNVILDSLWVLPVEVGADGRVYFNMGGIGAGQHLLHIEFGECYFEFTFVMNEIPTTLKWVAYEDDNVKDDQPGVCVYASSCNDIIFDNTYYKNPYINWDGSFGGPFESCGTPLLCSGVEEAVGNIYFDKKWNSGLTYKSAVAQAISSGLFSVGWSNYLINFSSSVNNEFPCRRVRYCTGNLKLVGFEPTPIINTPPLPSFVDEDGCFHSGCSYMLPYPHFEVACPEDVFHDVEPGSVAFENCEPTSASMHALCESIEALTIAWGSDFTSSTLYDFLLENCSLYEQKSYCVTCWFCANNFNLVGSDLQTVQCGISYPSTPECPLGILGSGNATCDPVDSVQVEGGSDVILYMCPDEDFQEEEEEECPIEINPDCIPEDLLPDSLLVDSIIACSFGSGFVPNSCGNNCPKYEQRLMPGYPLSSLFSFGEKRGQGIKEPLGVMKREAKDGKFFFTLLGMNRAPFIVSAPEEVTYFIEDWDYEYVLYSERKNESNAVVVFEQSNKVWLDTFSSSERVEIQHLSDDQETIWVGGIFEGVLSCNGEFLANASSLSAFVLTMNYDGKVLKTYVLPFVSPADPDLIFSLGKNAELFLGGNFLDLPIMDLPFALDEKSSNASGFYVVRFSKSKNPAVVHKISGEGGYELIGMAYTGSVIVLGLYGNGVLRLNGEEIFSSPLNYFHLLYLTETEGLANHGIIAGQNLDVENLAISSDTEGHIGVGVTFEGDLKFDSEVLTGIGGKDVAILVFNTSGKLLWSQVLGSSQSESVSQLMMDQGRLYWGGELEGAIFSRDLGAIRYLDYVGGEGMKAYISFALYQEPSSNEQKDSLKLKAPSSVVMKQRIGGDDLLVYPNPFTNSFTVYSKSELIVEVAVRDIFGKEFYRGKILPKTEKVVSLPKLHSGVFVLVGYDVAGNILDQVRILSYGY